MRETIVEVELRPRPASRRPRAQLPGSVDAAPWVFDDFHLKQPFATGHARPNWLRTRRGRSPRWDSECVDDATVPVRYLSARRAHVRSAGPRPAVLQRLDLAASYSGG